MIIDFPDYSNGNPWQIKTIETASQMPVSRVNVLAPTSCRFFHISWEDILLKNCINEKDANGQINKLNTFLNAQKKRSKIIWTVHNLTSHYLNNKNAENAVRELLQFYSDKIILMSDKHCFAINKEYHDKIRILPHYIEVDKDLIVQKRSGLIFFRYGEDRGETSKDLYQKILNSKNIRKFISDKRLNREIDDGENVIVKRRFSRFEEILYAKISNFSIFYREPKFNSGVINFMIGNKLSIFHDENSVKYMDLPNCYKRFAIDHNDIDFTNLEEEIKWRKNENDELEDYIKKRNPLEISKKFWSIINE
jgi:hypothetical protein